MTSNFVLFFTFINLIFYFLFFKFYKYIDVYDHPDNDLKNHVNSMPVFGGFLFLGNFLVFFILDIFFYDFFFNNINRFSFIFLISSIGMHIMGLYDDKYRFNASKKTIIMIVLITFVLLSNNYLIIKNIKLDLIGEIILNEYSYIFTILCIYIFMNAYNMLDGADLNIALYNFFILLFFFYKTNYQLIFLLFLIANVFYFGLNFLKRSYFGNNGTYFFGFVLALLTIWFYKNSSNINEEDVVLVMLFPIFEMLRLFVSRIIKNKSPFYGDNNHFHHLITKIYGRIKGIFLAQVVVVFPVLFDYFFKVNMWVNILLFSFLYFSCVYYLRALSLKNIE